MRAEGIGGKNGGGMDDKGGVDQSTPPLSSIPEGRRVEEWVMRVEGIGGKESGGMDDEGGGDWREQEWRH